MSIQEEIIELRATIEQFAKANNLTIDEACKLLLMKGKDVQNEVKEQTDL
ncbi:hypothetical protein [Dysgonomonas sp. 521]|nr:hypothetical protein [Dysgonomonas sp. 521]